MNAKAFQVALLSWFDQFGRKDLPWQLNPTPYRVWVSEIMLQQTQVSMVISYYHRFMIHFPTVQELADASLDSVLHLWSGLGYYARARNMHQAAQIICSRGRFPKEFDELCALPGIGRSTAGAILSIAFKHPTPILDGNVKRVLTRFHAIEGWPGNARVSRELWQLSHKFTPNTNVAKYTQAIMDLGATVCARTKPDCPNCPIQKGCSAYSTGRTADLPMPRPKAHLPIRSCYMLLLVDKKGQIYLEKRPPVGIWGGLWSLPERATKDEVIDWFKTQGGETSSLRWLPARRHSFSHYHLDYKPVSALIDANVDAVMESGRSTWYHSEYNNHYGLPAPVNRLLNQM